jgi:hypothetical protein
MIEPFGPSSPDGLLLASIFCLTILAAREQSPRLHLLAHANFCSETGSPDTSTEYRPLEKLLRQVRYSCISSTPPNISNDENFSYIRSFHASPRLSHNPNRLWGVVERISFLGCLIISHSSSSVRTLEMLVADHSSPGIRRLPLRAKLFCRDTELWNTSRRSW